MVDDVLVDRGPGRDEDRHARALPPPGPPELLPRRRDRARVAGQDRRRPAGRCRRRAPARSSRRRRGPRRRAGRARSPGAPSAGSRRGSRGSATAARSSRAAPRAGPSAGSRSPSAIGRRRWSGDRPAGTAGPSGSPASAADPRAPGRGIEDRRIDEEHVALAGRSPVAIDEPGRPSREHRGQLRRIGDRRRAADDDRVAAVVAAQPEQPPDDVRDVAPEHAAVGVELVDDDDPELLEQLEPLRVVRQDRRVQHVRVADDDLAGLPDGRSDRRRACRRRRSPRRSTCPPPATAPRTPRPGPARAPWSGRGTGPGRPDRRRSPGGPAARSRASCPTRSA